MVVQNEFETFITIILNFKLGINYLYSFLLQADAELSTASLLGKRDNLTSSVEEIETDIKGNFINI